MSRHERISVPLFTERDLLEVDREIEEALAGRLAPVAEAWRAAEAPVEAAPAGYPPAPAEESGWDGFDIELDERDLIDEAASAPAEAPAVPDVRPVFSEDAPFPGGVDVSFLEGPEFGVEPLPSVPAGGGRVTQALFAVLAAVVTAAAFAGGAAAGMFVPPELGHVAVGVAAVILIADVLALRLLRLPLAVPAVAAGILCLLAFRLFLGAATGTPAEAVPGWTAGVASAGLLFAWMAARALPAPGPGA